MAIRLRDLCIGLTALGAALMPLSAAAQEFPKINLRFALYISENLVQSKNFKQWAEEVKEGSGGKITVQFFWSQSLGKASELLDLVSAGAVEMAAPAASYHTSKVPLQTITQLPLVYPSAKAAQLAAEAISATKAGEAEHTKNNVIPVAWTSLPTYHVLCNKPIRTVADFKDLKMRSYGEYLPVMWQKLGAVGVTVLAPEVYEGLQRGNIDCSYLPNDFSYAYKLHEVAKYYNTANFGGLVSWPIYINLKLWNSWPPHVHKLLLDAGKRVGERDRALVDAAGAEATRKMLEGGMEQVDSTEQAKLEETVGSFIDVWKAAMKERGLAAEAEEVAAAVEKVVAENK